MSLTGDTEPSERHGGVPAATPSAPALPVTFERRELDRILRCLWPQGRRRRVARLRHRFPERPRRVLDLPPVLRSPDLPHRKKSEAVAPPGRLQRDLGYGPDHAPRPRTRSGAAGVRQGLECCCGLMSVRRPRRRPSEGKDPGFRMPALRGHERSKRLTALQTPTAASPRPRPKRVASAPNPASGRA